MGVEQLELLLAVDEVGAGVHVYANHFRNFAVEAVEVIIEEHARHAQQVFRARASFEAGDCRLTCQSSLLQ